jgi:hypothetical protein
MKKLSLVLLLSGLFVSANAFCADPHLALQATYDSNDSIIWDLLDGDVHSAAQSGLNVMVAEGVQELRDSGETKLADKYEGEWNKQFSSYLLVTARLGILDLGDHDPLSAWLSNYYKVLFTKTNGAIRSIRLIEDINTMNYALAVVFSPNGKWRAQASSYNDEDRIEYRKHFIPFANIATYWVSLEVCKHYASDYGQLCDDAADELEHLMGRYVAPPVSDWVFGMAAGGESILDAQSIHARIYSEREFEARVMARVLR